MKGLDRNAPSVPPQNSPQEAQQVEMWKKYIQWEKSNPLRTEDQTLITKRGDCRSLETHLLWTRTTADSPEVGCAEARRLLTSPCGLRSSDVRLRAVPAGPGSSSRHLVRSGPVPGAVQQAAGGERGEGPRAVPLPPC